MAYIKAISYYLPETVLTNAELQQEFPDIDVNKISKLMGVTSRRISVEKTASDLALCAGKRLFAEEKIEKHEVDFLLFCTQSPDYFLPSTACVLQDKLGLSKHCGAFTFDLGCSGYVYGLAVANAFVESGLASNVLLLTGDTISHYLHPEDKNRLLFGDAASATLVSGGCVGGGLKIGETVYGSDGSGYDSLILRTHANRHMECTGNISIDENGNLRRDDYFYMNGEDIFNFTVDTVPVLVVETLKKNGLQKDDVSLFLFHQANKFMLNTLRKVCKLDKNKFYINMEETGNTTSSTIPIGLKKILLEKAMQKDAIIMIAGFGVGLSWAGTVLRF